MQSVHNSSSVPLLFPLTFALLLYGLSIGCRGTSAVAPGALPAPSLPHPPSTYLQGNSSRHSPHHPLPCDVCPPFPRLPTRHRHLGCGAQSCPVVGPGCWSQVGLAGAGKGQPQLKLTEEPDSPPPLPTPKHLHTI